MQNTHTATQINEGMKTNERAKKKEEYINEINGLIVSFGDVVVYVRTCTCSCVCKCRCVCVCIFMHGYESGTVQCSVGA